MPIAADQASDFLAPECEKLIAIAVDATARVYDLSTIDLGTPGAGVISGTDSPVVYVTLLADDADVYWGLSASAALVVTDTAIIAAGGALAFAPTRLWRCPKDFEQSRRIDRKRLRYLYLKTKSGTATARFGATSFAAQNGLVLP